MEECWQKQKLWVSSNWTTCLATVTGSKPVRGYHTPLTEWRHYGGEFKGWLITNFYLALFYAILAGTREAHLNESSWTGENTLCPYPVTSCLVPWLLPCNSLSWIAKSWPFLCSYSGLTLNTKWCHEAKCFCRLVGRRRSQAEASYWS